MRQPLEDNVVTIARAERTVTFPANFMLVAAMNPCPCGYYGHPEITCKCSLEKIKNYLSRLSGPIVDRIDIQIEVPPVTFNELSNGKVTESSGQLRNLVIKAREIQLERFKGTKIYSNSEMSHSMVEKHCDISQSAKKLMQSAMTRLKFSARSYDKILKVSRTIADIAGREKILDEDLMEALQYRSVEKLIR